MGNTSHTSGNFNGLDVAKFIMAILVVTLHAHPLQEWSYNLNYAMTNGVTRIAVPYFFIASGFLLFRKTTLYDFDRARIKRYLIHIFRLYMVWTAIYLPIILWMAVHHAKGATYGILVAIRNTVMAGSYFQLWFLQALLVAVIILALLLYWHVSLRNIFWLTFMGYVVALIGEPYYCVFAYFFPDGSFGYEVAKGLKKVFVTPRNGICFGALFVFVGAYLSQRNCHIPLSRLKIYMACGFVLLLAEVMGTSFSGITQHGYMHDCYFMLLPLTICIFLYSKAVELPDLPIWSYLRKQSMFIFYIHTWWLFLANAFLGSGKHAIVNLGSFGVYLVVLVLSILSSHVIIVLSRKPRFAFLRYLS